MPLLGTIFHIVVHCIFALGLNWVAREFNLINYGEVITVYFIILAARYYDSQVRFTLAYKQDPAAIEQILREQLDEEY